MTNQDVNAGKTAQEVLKKEIDKKFPDVAKNVIVATVPTEQKKVSAENQTNTTAQGVKKVSADSETKADAPKGNEIKVVEKQSVENEMQKKQAEIELLKKQLELQLEKIARKNEIANNREIFLTKKREILNVQKLLLQNNDFEVQNVKLSFSYQNSFNGRSQDQYFTISNRELILKFVENLLSEIEIKIKQIENELISD